MQEIEVEAGRACGTAHLSKLCLLCAVSLGGPRAADTVCLLPTQLLPVLGIGVSEVAKKSQETFLIQQESAGNTGGRRTKHVELVFWRHGLKHCAIAGKKADDS